MIPTPQFLGRGLAFPLRLDATKTRLEFTQDEERVFESIDAILNTRIGERPHRVKDGVPYGTRFQALLFSNVSSAMDIADYDARRALSVWEPRIVVMDVGVSAQRDPAAGLFGIVIDILFKYRASNRVDNYISFYRSKIFDASDVT